MRDAYCVLLMGILVKKWLMLLRQPATKHKFLLVFGGFWWFFSVFCRKLLDFCIFLSVVCAAGGQHEVPYRHVDMSRQFE